VNWLGHLLLSPPDAAGWLGALLGDVLKGPLRDDLPPAVRRSVALHRAVDAFTDVHPAFLRSCGRLDPAHRHYRRIAVDLFYDFVLANTWERWHPAPLEAFVSAVHAALDAEPRAADVPFYPLMREQGWLMSYRAQAGIGTALSRMGARLRRPYPLHAMVPALTTERDGLTADFIEFFADARRFAAGHSRG
jgi:acyl carrier protein phosphodiesterase